MFNKTLFNRNAFNRSVSLSSISIPMSSNSLLRLQPVLRVSTFVNQMSGTSNMRCGVIMQQHMDLTMAGMGDLDDPIVNLATRIRPISLSGSGSITPRFSIATPFRGNITSTGNMKIDNNVYFLQYMKAHITSHGTFKTDFIMQSYIDPITFEGMSELKGNTSLHLPLTIEHAGTGEFVLRRLSAINVNVLELIDIDIPPGGTITIDTDLLQVLIGSKEDVSSITRDSVFFELNPGENEITISSDSDSKLDVVAIWQNRWL